MTPPDLDQPQHPLADLTDRTFAFLIDAVILFVIIVSITMSTVPIIDKLLFDNNYFYFALVLVLFCTTVFVQVIWGGLLEGIWGLTPGKTALRLKRKPVKLKVVSADDHNQTIGFARGIAREIIRPIPYMPYLLFLLFDVEASEQFYGVLLLLSLLVFVLDHLWPGRDKERQALHDKIANSHVVNTHKG